MTPDFKWGLPGELQVLNYPGMPDAVVRIEWRLIGTDPDNGNEVVETGVFLCAPPQADNFVPFNKLTAALVEDWLTAGVNADELAAKKMLLTHALERMTEVPIPGLRKRLFVPYVEPSPPPAPAEPPAQ